MDRKQLCDLLLDGINESSTDEQIEEHVKAVLVQTENYIKDQYGIEGSTVDRIENINLLCYWDLAEAIKNIVERNLYHAVTRIWDFLLKGKKYEVPVGAYELYITCLFLKGLLISR